MQYVVISFSCCRNGKRDIKGNNIFTTKLLISNNSFNVLDVCIMLLWLITSLFHIKMFPRTFRLLRRFSSGDSDEKV